MAKTKGSNPPVRDLLYEDAGGILHYFGEFFRGIFKEGYISPDDPEVDITGQSTRGERPTQQGTGTPSQEEIRTRYKNCIALWHSLPLVCPDPLPDPPPTSKKSVWDAKQEHGVVCSYYDLFMRCCLKWARDHDNEMPDGDCFPCELDCSEVSPLLWDFFLSAETIDQEGSAGIAIKDGLGPFTWAVSGTGFSLSSYTTSGLLNTLLADSEACGSATITVTDACDNIVNGYVRCTAGGWVLKPAENDKCVSPGYSTPVWDGDTVKKYDYVSGNCLQHTELRRVGVFWAEGYSCDNQYDPIICTESQYGCLKTPTCIGNGIGCLDCAETLLVPCVTIPLGYECWCQNILRYYEWECV